MPELNTHVWILWLTLTAAAIILTYNPLYLTTLFTLLIIISIKQEIDYKKYLKTTLFFALLPLLVNVFFVHRGNTILYTIPHKTNILSLSLPLLLISGPITLESIIFGLITTLLLANMLLAFGIFSEKTNPDSILRITPKTFFNTSLIVSIAMRFTPVISNDLQAIKDAQRSRGLNLKKGNLISKLIKHKALIVPSMVSSLERSFNLAESMAARGYTKNRTKYTTEKWSKTSYIVILSLLISLTILLYSKASGLLTYWPYDTLTPTPHTLPIISLIMLTIPLTRKCNHK